VERQERGAAARAEPRTLSLADAHSLTRGCAFVVGNGLPLLPAMSCTALSTTGPTASGLAACLERLREGGPIDDERETLVPVYCRAPDAKLPASA
jgi:hypothetical protein